MEHEELYDLRADPEERTDISSSEPELARVMHESAASVPVPGEIVTCSRMRLRAIEKLRQLLEAVELI